MPMSQYDRDDLFDKQEGGAKQAPEPGQAKELQWASTVGNSAVQRIARSASGRKAPVGPGSLPQASGILARQENDEMADGEGGEQAPEAAPEGEAAAPEGPEAEQAAPEGQEAGQEEEAA